MVTKILGKIFGTQHEREMKRLQPMVDRINHLEPALKELSTDQLKAKTPEFRQRLANGEPLDALLPEAFAVTREAARRVLGMRHYDVQLIGGMVLQRGAIAEMKTGEGKTLVATLPLYLHGLTQKGAHLVTVNDYLAKRDKEWMGQVYHFLGLTTGTIVHDLSDRQRKEAYGADITYGTNNEFGFDYLRDNMKFRLEDYVQRGHNFAIVDECDSILIDEARTPLIISGPAEDSTTKYYEINKIIPQLEREKHFTMEEKSRTVSLTEEGNARAEELLGLGNLYDPENIQIVHHVYQALKAHHLYHKDVDYMIKDGEIIIVDEFTGRLMPGRRWSDGMHQAVEAKEGVRIRSENQTLATITFQNYFRMYSRLSGMTGTAETEALEMHKIYNLDVVVIPTNKPIRRDDHEDIVYKSEAAKFRAIAEDIKSRQEKGQPILVGTVSIERSERISRLLRDQGITHNVLNAKHHEREAEIVAQAGRRAAVTIATNMAGRGTDIVLGGNAESLAKVAVQGNTESPEYQNVLAKFKEECAKEREEVVSAGGLYIVGTERHESRRIDNQLRGRSGRQGDPGESRFYLSLEDDLMRKFNGERIQWIMTRLNVPDDEPIMARMVSRAIESAQRKVEGYNFDIRKHLLDFDNVMNQQRTAIYTMRREILGGEKIDRVVLDFLEDVTSAILDQFVPAESDPKAWDIEGMNTALTRQFGVKLVLNGQGHANADAVAGAVAGLVKQRFDAQKEKLGPFMVQLQKNILLQTIDEKWKDHLAQIDQLREGINLRAYAQKDPLIEYKKEAFRLFEIMNLTIRSESIETLLKIQIVEEQAAKRQFEERQKSLEGRDLDYSGGEEEAAGGGFETPTYPKEDHLLPGLGGGRPPQRLQYGPASGEGPKLNRAERRRREKLSRKGR